MTPPERPRVERPRAGRWRAVRWSVRRSPAALSLAALSLPVLLAGCTSGGHDRLQPEQFGSVSTHSRDYGAATSATCEAARRALLSQGYVITLADADHVNGKKNFQPDPATHVEVEFHVVCAVADRQGHRSIAFVNALQDRYALKKSNNSASLGVSVLGSVSLPFSSSDDSLVKVASETITTEVFYERFFALLERYLAADTTEDISTSAPAPLPLPASPAPALPAPALPLPTLPAPAPPVSAAASVPASTSAAASSPASTVGPVPAAAALAASAASGSLP